jgi:hypothetical protein
VRNMVRAELSLLQKDLGDLMLFRSNESSRSDYDYCGAGSSVDGKCTDDCRLTCTVSLIADNGMGLDLEHAE